MDEETVRRIIREELAFMVKNKKLVFPYPMQILDGNDITLAKNIGTMIGTASDQKLGVLGKTPRVRYPTVGYPSGGAVVDNEARGAASDALNILIEFGFLEAP